MNLIVTCRPKPSYKPESQQKAMAFYWKDKYDGTPNIDRIINPLRDRWVNTDGLKTEEEKEAKKIENLQKEMLYMFTTR